MTYSEIEIASSATPTPVQDIAPERVIEALSELLNNPGFKASARNKRFLRFVVEQKLAGRAGKIKSYVIAVDVFGRRDTFDPEKDPIVRIEATRLRAAIDLYYSSWGLYDEIRFSLPKGGYVPTIEMRAERPAEDQRAGGSAGPSHFASGLQ